VKIGQLRNLGCKKAKGSVLAFLDSDYTVDRSWLKYVLTLLSKIN